MATVIQHVEAANPTGLRPVAREIWLYLTQHPQAQDTLEGISQWWLPERGIRASVAETKAAIDQLLAGQLVIARCGPDGRVRYGKLTHHHRKTRSAPKGGTSRSKAATARPKRAAPVRRKA